MLSRAEMESAIREYEDSQPSYQNCERLATLYTLYDHLYSNRQEVVPRYVDEETVGEYGESDFFQAITGKEAAQVWQVVGELVDAVSVLNPRLYTAMMEKL